MTKWKDKSKFQKIIMIFTWIMIVGIVGSTIMAAVIQFMQ
ncbi:DUF4044 domain-containing protein [Lactobacillus sp. S2-2]|nr:DUF4044 domain-containing protein [Lactobacillus sp. S2-2]MCF6514847.1 DUF4044 domain-containing protein [Lactobacillus sp. S2-2]